MTNFPDQGAKIFDFAAQDVLDCSERLSVEINYWCTALMRKMVKMPIAHWLPYPPPLYINIGFGLWVLKILDFGISSISSEYKSEIRRSRDLIFDFGWIIWWYTGLLLVYPFLPVSRGDINAFLSGFFECWLAETRIKSDSDPVIYRQKGLKQLPSLYWNPKILEAIGI